MDEKIDVQSTLLDSVHRLRIFAELLSNQSKDAIYTQQGLYGFGTMLREITDELYAAWAFLDGKNPSKQEESGS